MSRTPFQTEHLGLIPYGEALALQKAYHAEIVAGHRTPTLLLLEHPRTITLGRSTKPSSLLLSEEAYRQRGFEVHAIDRGGDVTYHGPGQLVGYPLFRIEEKVGDFLRQIERALLRALEQFGIFARPSPGYAGIWAKKPSGHEAKLAAIGIAVTRRVSLHGFALNVTTDLSDFRTIIPCGLAGIEVTSIQELLGTSPSLSQVATVVQDAFEQVFSLSQA
jgi:lipoyl(octanoyl) transferase